MATKKTVSFSASFELDNKINEVFERLEKTDWVLDKTTVNKSTLIRSAILEGLAVLEKKYLGGKNDNENYRYINEYKLRLEFFL